MKNIAKVCGVYLAALIIAPLTAGAQTDLVKFDAPTEQKISGFDKVFCVKTDDTARICSGLSSVESSSGDARFFIERGGREIGAWKAAAFLGDVSRFEVWRADLDNDGADEIVVANFDGQSNGMGVVYRTIYILPSVWKNSEKPIEPLRFSAEDFSVRDGFVKKAKTESFEITVTNWEWNWQLKGKKTGLYLVGRRYGYKNGALAASAKSLAVRRYTKTFEKERGAASENENVSFSWMNSGTVESRNTDLMNTAEAETVFDGVIETAKIAPLDSVPTSESSTPMLTLKLKIKDGTNRTLEYLGEPAGAADSSFAYFGDGQTRRIFPKNYLPANASEMLANKKARLVRYRDRNGGGFKVLWLSGDQ